MAQYRAIIFITKDTLQTFKVVDEKYEALNSKGLSYINYNSESDLAEYADILKTKYNIDDFSEINISFSIINVGAEDKYIDSLKELLDGAERIDVNNIEKLIPLVLASKGEIKTNTALQEDYEEARKRIEQLEDEKNKLIEDSKKQTDEIDNLVSQIASLKDEIESIKNAKIEAEKLEEQKLEKERELSKSIYKIDFLKNAEEYGIVFSIPKEQTVTFNKKFKNGDKVSQGSVIAYYKDNRYTNSFVYGNGIPIIALKAGTIYYMVNDNAKVKNGDVIAVIGEENWTKDDAIHFLKQSSKSETQKKNECESVIIKADVIKDFKSESPIPPSFVWDLSDELEELNGVEYEKDKTINGCIVEKGQVLFKIKEFKGLLNKGSEFLIKAPCTGKIFCLVRTKGSFINTSVKADTSLAIIVPESWSKSQAIEWYRSVEPLEEPHELCVGAIDYYAENNFPEYAYVLPDDEYIKFTYYNGEENTNYSKEYCCVAGKIRYENGKSMNQGYKHSGGIVARIY